MKYLLLATGLLALGAQAQVIPGKVMAHGQITKRLSYPSESIPADIRVTAVPTAGNGAAYSTAKHAAGNRYGLSVPPGRYYVYATTKALPNYKAYYTESVTCGLKVECTSHAKIPVVVTAGTTTAKIDPADWYDDDMPATTAPMKE